jgi:uncharacterized protein (DUF736 family)
MEMYGNVFKNNFKKTDKHPDYRGSFKMNDIEYEAAGWIKQDKNGVSYLSIKISDKKSEYVVPKEYGSTNPTEEKLPF